MSNLVIKQLTFLIHFGLVPETNLYARVGFCYCQGTIYDWGRDKTSRYSKYMSQLSHFTSMSLCR